MTVDIMKLKKRLAIIAASLFAAASLATVMYYIIFPSARYFHADCSDTILWAQASFDSGSLFNKDFAYAAMLPFGGTMLMIPFIGIFGVSMTTHHIGMVLFTLLFFAGVFLLCRSLEFSLPSSLFTVGILSMILCASEKMREIFYEHVIYYSISVLIICVLLSLLIKFRKSIDENNKAKLAAVTACIVVFTACCALDGMQVIATGVVPVIFAAVAEMFFNGKRKLVSSENKASVYYCIICGGSVVIGLFALAILSKDVSAGYATAYTQYSDMNEWLGNLDKLPVHWFELFGVDAQYGMLIFSPESILNIIRIACALIVATVPVAALIFYKKLSLATKLLVLTHFGTAAVIMFGYIFGILSAANWRLSPLICTGIIVCVASAKAVKDYVVPKRIAVLCICILVMMSAVSFAGIVQMEKNSIEHNEKYKLSQILEENGLTYGFATFWNSQAITVLSDSRVMAVNVDIDEKGIAPCHYQTNKKWFEEQEGADRYFVLASDYELAVLESTADQVYFDLLAEEIIEIDGYKIFVFSSLDFLN